MSELGQMLRDARESKGISLAEAEEATKIRRKYLQALEGADYSALPPSIYARGFLRNYAAYLGLNAEEALAAFHNGAQAHREPREPHIISEPLASGSRINWELAAGVLMLAAVGILLVFVYQQYVAPLAVRSAEPPPTVTEVLGLAPVDTPARMVNDDPTAIPTRMPTATPPPPTPVPPTFTATQAPRPTVIETLQPGATQELTLKLTTTARSWLRIVLDGETAFEGILEPGDEQLWRARREIAMRTGNAGGLTVTVNGQEIGVLGDSGEVLDRIWRLSDSGQVVMSTPTP